MSLLYADRDLRVWKSVFRLWLLFPALLVCDTLSLASAASIIDIRLFSARLAANLGCLQREAAVPLRAVMLSWKRLSVIITASLHFSVAPLLWRSRLFLRGVVALAVFVPS